jgi:hypothetical protein
MGPGQAAGDVEGPRAARRLATWALGDRRASGHWHRVSLTPGGGRTPAGGESDSEAEL